MESRLLSGIPFLRLWSEFVYGNEPPPVSVLLAQ